ARHVLARLVRLLPRAMADPRAVPRGDGLACHPDGYRPTPGARPAFRRRSNTDDDGDPPRQRAAHGDRERRRVLPEPRADHLSGRAPAARRHPARAVPDRRGRGRRLLRRAIEWAGISHRPARARRRPRRGWPGPASIMRLALALLATTVVIPAAAAQA